MQKCYNCGKEVSDETLICPECGALVKRYTTPAPRLDEQPDEPERGVTDDGYASMFRDRPNRPRRRADEPRQNGMRGGAPDADGSEDRLQESGAYSAPPTWGQPLYPERPRGSVWRDERGRVHFGTGLMVWLVAALLVTGYFVFGYGALLIILRFQDTYLAMFDAMPEFSEMAALLRTMLETISFAPWLVLVLLITSGIHFAATLWFLIGKRRAALIVFLVMTVLSGLGMLLGAPVLGIAALAAAAVTFFWVRKYWSLLR